MEAPASAGVDLIGKVQRLGFDFGHEAANKTAQVNAIAQAGIEFVRAGRQINRRGNRGAANNGRVRRRFAQIFQGEIPSQTKSDQGDARIAWRHVLDHGAQVLGRAAVIHAHQPVWLGAAAAKVPGQHIPIVRRQDVGHALDVALVDRSLQTMRQNGEARPIGAQPVQIEEIAVRQLEALGFKRAFTPVTQDRAQNGLEVGVPEKERRAEFTWNNRHKQTRTIQMDKESPCAILLADV